MRREVREDTIVTAEEILSASREYDRKKSEVIQVVNVLFWLIKESGMPDPDFLWYGSADIAGITGWQMALREEREETVPSFLKKKVLGPPRIKLQARCYCGNFLLFTTDPTWTQNPSYPHDSQYDLQPLGLKGIAKAHATLDRLIVDARRSFPKLSGEIEQLFSAVDGWQGVNQ